MVRENIGILRENGRRCIEQKLEALERQEDVPNDIFTLFLKESMQLEGDDRLTMDEFIDEFVTLFVAGEKILNKNLD